MPYRGHYSWAFLGYKKNNSVGHVEEGMAPTKAGEGPSKYLLPPFSEDDCQVLQGEATILSSVRAVETK